ncbi:MAG: hypothetical protein JWN86_2609 [Planctomycetota bacterium]|nr:hypothetical protein [Planctomycetota bacterium]
MSFPVQPFSEGRAAWVDDLDRVAQRNRWGLALVAVGWVHLAGFGTCEWLHAIGDRHRWHFVALWAVEFVTVLAVLRGIAGRGWIRSTPLAGIIGRVWGTVLILSFNLASLNVMSGLEHEWFKPVLCTVAAFGFMMMAYLVSAWFFAAAVQMYFTGLIMVNYLAYAYLIHGVSWWAALMVIGGSMELRRRRAMRQARPILIRITLPSVSFPGRRLTFRAERSS